MFRLGEITQLHTRQLAEKNRDQAFALTRFDRRKVNLQIPIENVGRDFYFLYTFKSTSFLRNSLITVF